MNKRLFSLDVLRGFDMLLLLYGSVIAWSLKGVSWWPEWMLTQFSHPWGVYTLFDVIQPLFAFICGAGIPMALTRRMQDGRAAGPIGGTRCGGSSSSISSAPCAADCCGSIPAMRRA